jgi:predicted choloylglycine hydrolase
MKEVRMNQEQTTKTAVFSHVTLRGSAYEVGKAQGEAMRQFPQAADFFRSGLEANKQGDFDSTLKMFDRYCPGINDEIKGFADGLGIPFESVVYYSWTRLRPRHCSHFVALPSLTESGHVLVGRNYDFGEPSDDLRLCTTAVDGCYAHLGFSSVTFGRLDGMNEHGLSVTMSAGGIPVGLLEGLTPPIQDGLIFWALIRTLLERCKTVDEALVLCKEIPSCGNPILILADANGNAALVEIYGPTVSVKKIDAASPEQFLLATNHFVLPETRSLEPTMMEHSRCRHQVIQSALQQAAPRVNVDGVKKVLSTSYPDGLSCHFYDEFFGTLHSLVFDLNEKKAQICFGSPAVNEWHEFDLNGSAPTIYPVKLPREKTGPDFWKIEK